MATIPSVIELLFYVTIGVIVGTYTVALALLQRNSPEPADHIPHGILPSVSLVVPTYNEASVIRQKLENILKLDYPRDKLEVLVVDSASTDKTVEIVRRFAEDHRREIKVGLIVQPIRRGKSEAINDALRNVRSDILALTDADVTFPADSLRKLVENLTGPEVGAVSGVEVPVGQKSFVSGIEADYRRVYTAIRLAEAGTDAPFMCESELSVYRRDILEPLRPGVVCDDVELTVMVRSKGFKALYSSDVPFFENEAGSFQPKLYHKLRRGMNNQHALLHNSKVLFNRRLGGYGTIVFPFEFFVHIVSPILLTASLILFLALAIASPVSALYAILVVAAISAPSLLILHSLINKHRAKDVANLQGTGSWLLGAGAFLAFQLILFAGLFKLAFKGPQTNWQQVPGTRVPIAVEASG